jgi:hypothetical protein
VAFSSPEKCTVSSLFGPVTRTGPSPIAPPVVSRRCRQPPRGKLRLTDDVSLCPSRDLSSGHHREREDISAHALCRAVAGVLCCAAIWQGLHLRSQRRALGEDSATAYRAHRPPPCRRVCVKVEDQHPRTVVARGRVTAARHHAMAAGRVKRRGVARNALRTARHARRGGAAGIGSAAHMNVRLGLQTSTLTNVFGELLADLGERGALRRKWNLRVPSRDRGYWPLGNVAESLDASLTALGRNEEATPPPCGNFRPPPAAPTWRGARFQWGGAAAPGLGEGPFLVPHVTPSPTRLAGAWHPMPCPSSGYGSEGNPSSGENHRGGMLGIS